MKRTSGRVLLFTAALAVAVATSIHPTAAATGPHIDSHKVHAATLTARQITKASGTGYAAQTMGVNCTLRGPQGAIACWQKYPHSDGALTAKAPWVTHVNVFAFPTVASAKKYLAHMGERIKGAITSTGKGIRLVGVDRQSHISDGMSIWMGAEASVIETVGTQVVWTACGDPTGTTATSELTRCAQSVAKAQVNRLP
jgi:hypothetical protein